MTHRWFLAVPSIFPNYKKIHCSSHLVVLVSPLVMPIPTLETKHIKLLSELGVQAVYLFGSRAVGKSGPFSDYDYAVLLKKNGHYRGDKLYFRLHDILSEISKRRLKNDVIDIVFLRDSGLELAFHVIRYGKIIFEKDTKARLHFETITILKYCDYRPILDEFDNAILEAI